MKKTFLHTLEENNQRLMRRFYKLQAARPFLVYKGLLNYLKETAKWEGHAAHEIGYAMAYCDPDDRFNKLEKMYPNSDPSGQSGPTEQEWYVKNFFWSLK